MNEIKNKLKQICLKIWELICSVENLRIDIKRLRCDWETWGKWWVNCVKLWVLEEYL